MLQSVPGAEWRSHSSDSIFVAATVLGSVASTVIATGRCLLLVIASGLPGDRGAEEAAAYSLAREVRVVLPRACAHARLLARSEEIRKRA